MKYLVLLLVLCGCAANKPIEKPVVPRRQLIMSPQMEAVVNQLIYIKNPNLYKQHPKDPFK